MKNEILIFENQGIKLEVNMKDETVWLTQSQMAKLFGKDVNTINDHINKIFKDGEVDRETSTGISGKSTGGRCPTVYNLDVIIGVGYRVKSQNGVIFRKWATKVLKEHLINGYTINQKRLEYLEKTVQLINIATRANDRLKDKDAKEVLKVISNYSKALDLLDDYDHRRIEKPKGINSDIKISYDECMSIISMLRFNEESDIFAIERNRGLESIINNIYQTFDNCDVYKSIEEKASNFLYMIIKNHVFIDGNKRIAATLFIYFLHSYDMLYRNDKQVIDNNTLAALTLLIAESNPKEKEIIIDLVQNFLI